MHPGIIAQIVISLVITIADIKCSLRTLVIDVVRAWLIRHHEDLVVLAIPFDFIYAHCWMVHIEHLKFAVMIASLEYQLLAVLPLKSGLVDIVGLGIDHGIVPSSILEHHGGELGEGIGHMDGAIICLDSHLLMVAIHVNVRVRNLSHTHPPL